MVLLYFKWRIGYCNLYSAENKFKLLAWYLWSCNRILTQLSMLILDTLLPSGSEIIDLFLFINFVGSGIHFSFLFS